MFWCIQQVVVEVAVHERYHHDSLQNAGVCRAVLFTQCVLALACDHGVHRLQVVKMSYGRLCGLCMQSVVCVLGRVLSCCSLLCKGVAGSDKEQVQQCCCAIVHAEAGVRVGVSVYCTAVCSAA